MPKPTDLYQDAAYYIANHLIYQRLLVGTDPQGYELALGLARRAGAMIEADVRDRLAPLVERSMKAGQQPPSGW